MSKRVFVSWSTPDRATFERATSRLEDSGIALDEYSRVIRAGEFIPKWVGEAIDAADIAVIFLSHAAVQQSEWIRYEAALIANNLARGILERAIIVRIGDLADAEVPGMLDTDRTVVRQFSAEPTEEQMADLVVDVREALGKEAPLVLPAACYAMSRIEFQRLVDADQQGSPSIADQLAELCRRVGMASETPIWQTLEPHYGDTSDDYAPFNIRQPGKGTPLSLKDVVHAVLHSVNERRTLEGRRPIHIRWLTRKELDSDYTVQDMWRNDYSLLFVDAVSALDREIASELSRLPRSRDPRLAAVVLLPPYTSHTGQLEATIEQLFEIAPHSHAFLSPYARDWRNRIDPPPVAFDLPSAASLRRWVADLLQAIDDPRTVPVPDRVTAMTRGEPPRSLRIFGTAPGAHQ